MLKKIDADIIQIRGGSKPVLAFSEAGRLQILHQADDKRPEWMGAVTTLDYGEARELAEFIVSSAEENGLVQLGRHEHTCGITGCKGRRRFNSLRIHSKRINQQVRALALSSETLEVHYEDDADLYDADRQDAESQYMKARGSLNWAGKVYLVQMLLDDLADDLEIAEGDSQS